MTPIWSIDPGRNPWCSPWACAWLAIFLGCLLWSGIEPRDRLTWALEVAPAVIGFLVLALTRRVFPLTPLLYGLLLGHFVLLMVGGHYTYAEVPWFEGLFEWQRNNFDKLAHFTQGFVPVLAAREIALRFGIFGARGWMNFFLVCFALALSAAYELFEWLAAQWLGRSAESFLGMQGYQWDTQTDMALALVGAITALIVLGRWHDSQLKPWIRSVQTG